MFKIIIKKELTVLPNTLYHVLHDRKCKFWISRFLLSKWRPSWVLQSLCICLQYEEILSIVMTRTTSLPEQPKTTSQQTLLISTKFLLTDQEKWRPFWIFSQNHVKMMCDVKNNTRNGFLIPKNLLSHVLHDHISSFVIFKFSVDQNGGHFGFLAPKSYAHPGF